MRFLLKTISNKDTLYRHYFSTQLLEYAIGNVQETLVGLKLNEVHQLLVYDDDVNLMGDNINTIEKNREVVIDASKEVGLEVNTEKTNILSRARCGKTKSTEEGRCVATDSHATIEGTAVFFVVRSEATMG
jgi:hypothetical protein